LKSRKNQEADVDVICLTE